MPRHVRPTKRALSDSGLEFPTLDVELHTINDALLRKAQSLPEEVAAGGAERIRSLTDRVWFKTKTTNQRGAAGEAHTPEAFGPQADADLPGSAWWLVAAGHRQGDTKNRDFYELLAAECVRAAKDTAATVRSDHLAPLEVDYRRWEVERVTLVAITLQRQVREAIARAAQTGSVWRVTIGSFQIGAMVKHEDGESYLAITADGFWDGKTLAVLLSAVPEVVPAAWQIEPSEVIGITPSEGQIIYSTMIPASSLAKILDEVDDHFL